jgi:hypothetical protein
MRTDQRPRRRSHAFVRTEPTSARTRLGPHRQAGIHAEAAIYPRGNFKTDAVVRLSHGRPSSHRPCPRLSVRPSA